jgi:hypothetical protein
VKKVGYSMLMFPEMSGCPANRNWSPDQNGLIHSREAEKCSVVVFFLAKKLETQEAMLFESGDLIR